MNTAGIELVSSDSLVGLRSALAAFMSTLPVDVFVNQTPTAVYRQNDGDTRYVTALSYQRAGVSDENLQAFVVEKQKLTAAQSAVDEALASAVHDTVTGVTAVAGTVTVSQPLFSAGDEGRMVRSGGQDRVITGVVSDTVATYAGSPLPASGSTPVSLLGAEALRCVSVDVFMAYDGDPSITVSFVPGSSLSSSDWPTGPLPDLVLGTGAVQTVSSDGQQLLPTSVLHRFQVSGGNRSLTSTPTIPTAGVAVGTVLILQNVGTTFHAQLNSGVATALSLSNANRTIDPGGNMSFFFDGTLWVELTHNASTTT